MELGNGLLGTAIGSGGMGRGTGGKGTGKLLMTLSLKRGRG